jgi:hypothetical protein
MKDIAAGDALGWAGSLYFFLIHYMKKRFCRNSREMIDAIKGIPSIIMATVVRSDRDE